jgi:hypothetical protein
VKKILSFCVISSSFCSESRNIGNLKGSFISLKGSAIDLTRSVQMCNTEIESVLLEIVTSLFQYRRKKFVSRKFRLLIQSMKKASDENQLPLAIGPHTLLLTKPEVDCSRMAIQLILVTEETLTFACNYSETESFLSNSYS